MTSIQCVCGTRVSASEDGDIFAPLRQHTDEAHAELGITDEQLRGLISRASGMNDWDGERLVLPENVEIHALSSERQQDFLDYFDREAFIDNPAWADCYCYFNRFCGTIEEWGKRQPGENRTDQAAAIADGSASGFLAYADGVVVAWCHAAPRGDLPLLDAGPTEEGDDRIGSIVCFNVSPRYRQQGLSKMLLETACATFAAEGFTVMEAYPALEFKTSAQAYHGSLSMFLDAGFERTGERESMAVVRKRFTA